MDKTKVFEAAGKFAAKGQFDKAAKEYQRILEEDPKDVRALQKLAEIYQKANKNKEATDLMLRVAEGYTEQGFFLKAVAVYKQVLKVGPERIEVNQRLAQLYQQLGLIGDATQQWQLVANHHDRQGNMKESLAAVRKMVELDPDNVASQVKLGELYARENMTKEAVAELRKAAAYLRRNSRIDDYIRVLERIGQLAADDVVVAKELAKHHLSQGDTKRALSKLQICFRADPKDVETLELLAQSFSALGQDTKTISVYRELASIFNIRNDAESERAMLGKILALAPDDEEANTRLREMSGVRAAPPPQARMERTIPPSARPQIITPPPPPAPPPPRPAAVAAPPARPEPPPPPPPAPLQAAVRPLDANLPPAIAKILTETDVYLKYGLLPKAAEHIRKALIEDPSCIPAHEKLLAIVDRQGKTEEVLHELERLVELAREAGDTDRDRAFTQELAQREPDHPLVVAAAAAAQLPEVGVDEDLVIDPDASWAPESRAELIDVNPSIAPPARSVVPLDTDPLSDDEDVVMDPEPLSIAPPSFRRPMSLSGAAVGAPSRTGTTLSFHLPQDDESTPFREPDLVDAPPDEASDLAMQAAFESSLPPPQSFGLPDPVELETSSEELHPEQEEQEDSTGSFETADHEGESLHEAADLGDEPAVASDEHSLEAEFAPADDGVFTDEHAVEEPEPEESHEESTSPAAIQSDEFDPYAEEYAEAEFLVSQGLTDDARTALQDILEKAPGHVGATALLQQLDGTSLEAPPFEAEPEGPVSHVNLTAELAEELEGEELGEPVQAPVANPHSVTDMLQEFKKALSTTVSAEDSQTHYDLGIAYREMGLIDEAIHEFEVASQSRGRKHLLDCLMMLGMCHLERSGTREALEYFTQALQAPGLTLEASKEAHFQIGVCHDTLDEQRPAMEHYARVYKADPDYRDVKPRLARVTRLVRAAAARPVASNGTHEPPAPALEPSAPPEPRAGRGKIGYI